jgi:tryptophan synthase alpha chain
MTTERLLQKGGKPKLVAYLVAGDPSLEETEAAIAELVKNGVDVLELGVPFTDAMADGPVIQAASERAARKGISLTRVLELATRLRKTYPELGLVLFTYFNPVFKMGLEKFADETAKAGIDAVLTVDLPPEEAGAYLKALETKKVGTIFLASPTTARERIKVIDQASTAFIYYVSRVGVTGVQVSLSQTIEKELAALRKETEKPIAVGFGISTGAQAAQLAPFVDAVVVGSAFVKILSEGKGSDLKAGRLAQELKQAL